MWFLSEDLFYLTNSVDPDEMQHYAAFHLGLHCLQRYSFRGVPNTKGWHSLDLLREKKDKMWPYLPLPQRHKLIAQFRLICSLPVKITIQFWKLPHTKVLFILFRFWEPLAMIMCNWQMYFLGLIKTWYYIYHVMAIQMISYKWIPRYELSNKQQQPLIYHNKHFMKVSKSSTLAPPQCKKPGAQSTGNTEYSSRHPLFF